MVNCAGDGQIIIHQRRGAEGGRIIGFARAFQHAKHPRVAKTAQFDMYGPKFQDSVADGGNRLNLGAAVMALAKAVGQIAAQFERVIARPHPHPALQAQGVQRAPNGCAAKGQGGAKIDQGDGPAIGDHLGDGQNALSWCVWVWFWHKSWALCRVLSCYLADRNHATGMLR